MRLKNAKKYLLIAEINWLVSARKYYDNHYIFWKQIVSDSQGQLKRQGQFSQQSWNMYLFLNKQFLKSYFFNQLVGGKVAMGNPFFYHDIFNTDPIFGFSKIYLAAQIKYFSENHCESNPCPFNFKTSYPTYTDPGKKKGVF